MIILKNNTSAITRLWLLGLLLMISGYSRSQELMEPILKEVDSLRAEGFIAPVNPILLKGFLNGNFLNSLSENKAKLDLPDFDSILKSRWIITRSEFSASGTAYAGILSNDVTGFSPFLSSGTLYNQASYRVSDRFVIGGAGYGFRSVFSAPLPGNLTKPLDMRGATMFFQYKVSPNFKIETRISVTQSPGM